MWITQDGWAPNAPQEVIDGSAIYPGAMVLWNAFIRLSKGRAFSMFGAPLPISYRDMRDEAARCRWFDDEEAERILRRLDDEFLALAEGEMKEKGGTRHV